MSKAQKTQPHSRLDSKLRAVAWAGVYAGLLTPLVYLPFLWHPFSTGKVWYLQTVVGLTFPAWLLLAWRQPEYRPPRSLVWWGLGAQLLSMALSLPGASDWHLGFWGATDKMDGLVTHLHFAGWCVMTVSLVRAETEWRRVLRWVAAGGGLSALVAILQIWNPTLLGTAAGARVSGLLGNPVFLGAYHAQVVLLTALLWAREKPSAKRVKWLLGSVMGLSWVAMMAAGSRGPLLGLVGGTLVAAAAYVVLAGKRRIALGLGLALGLLLTTYLGVAKLALPHPGLAEFWAGNRNLAHVFELSDNSKRLRLWNMTMAGVWAHPVLGWGQGNYEYLVARHYDPAEGCATQSLNDPHNAILDHLANRGLVGLAAFLFLWGAALVTVFRAVRRKELELLPGSILMGLVVSTQIPNLFNPLSPGPLLLTHLVLALVVRSQRPPPLVPAKSSPAVRPWLLPLSLGVGWAVVVGVNLLPAYASYHAVRSLRAYHQGDRARAWSELQRAASLPTPYLEEQLAIGIQQLVRLAETNTLDRFSAWKDLLSLDRELMTRYLRHHRKNHFRLSWLIALHKLGIATGDSALLREADQGFRAMRSEQPKQQEILYALGEFLADQGKLEEAEEVFESAVALDPGVGESHFRRGAFVWKYRRQAERGSGLIRQATLSECPYTGVNLVELSQTAQALFKQRDVDGIRALSPLAEVQHHDATGKSYLLIASYLEGLGLRPERDRVLRAAAQWSPQSASGAKRVLEGRVPSVSELLKAMDQAK